MDYKDKYEKVMKWIKNNTIEGNGITVTSKEKRYCRIRSLVKVNSTLKE